MLQERWFALHGRGGGSLLHNGARSHARYTYDLAGPASRPAIGSTVPLLAPQLGPDDTPAPSRSAPLAADPAPAGDAWSADDPYLAHLQRLRGTRHAWLDGPLASGIPV